jgi:hypothetical protein
MITHLGGLLLIPDKFCVMVHCVGTMWSVMKNVKIVSFCIQRPMMCIIIIYVVSPLDLVTPLAGLHSYLFSLASIPLPLASYSSPSLT